MSVQWHSRTIYQQTCTCIAFHCVAPLIKITIWPSITFQVLQVSFCCPWHHPLMTPLPQCSCSAQPLFFHVPAMFPQLSHISPSHNDLWVEEPSSPQSYLSSRKLRQTSELFWEIGTGSTWLPCQCPESILLQLRRDRATIKQGMQKTASYSRFTWVWCWHYLVYALIALLWLITEHHTL